MTSMAYEAVKKLPRTIKNKFTSNNCQSQFKKASKESIKNTKALINKRNESKEKNKIPFPKFEAPHEICSKLSVTDSGKEFQCQYYAKKKDGECHKVKKCSHINEEGKCNKSHQRVDDKKCTWSNEMCITEEEGRKEDCMLRVKDSEEYKPLLKTLNYFRSLIDYYIPENYENKQLYTPLPDDTGSNYNEHKKSLTDIKVYVMQS